MGKAGLAGLLLALGAANGGCTTQLQGVVPTADGTLPAKGNESGVPSGYSYQLPDLSYTILVTRTISKCPQVDAKNFAATNDSAVVDTRAIVTGALHPGTPVIIDYLKMGSAMKTTAFDAGNHDSGMIKSVNASIEDHSAAVITEGTKAVFNVAKLAMTLSNPVTLTSGNTTIDTKPRILCTEEAAAERVIADNAKAELTQKTKDLAAALVALDAATKAADKAAKPAAPAPAATLAAGTPAPAAPSAAATAAADDLEKKKNAVDAATKAQAAAQEAYDVRLKPLTAAQVIRWTPRAGSQPAIAKVVRRDSTATLIEHGLQLVYPDPAAPTKLKINGINADLDAVGDSATYASNIADLIDTMTVVASFTIPDGAWPKLTPATACPSGAKRGCGILYRTIARGSLRVCKTVLVADCDALADNDNALLARDDRVVPQAGMLVSLPLVNGAFVNNTLKASFREDSTLATMTYTSPKAAAEEGLKALNDALGSGQAFAEYRRDEPTAAAGRETALINALAGKEKAIADREAAAQDRLKKKEDDRKAAERAAALAAVSGDTEATNALVTNTNAHIALEEAEKKLQALRNPPSP
ncbi:hypothetical protein [Sphingomonas kyeonggiensis]|uniref:Uncharacterized protein n=1 Tax=Sphingomonas kyeonggiensis TaxID=1268553 RepID=A0A7W6JQ19_9SPHN|nr:hypothetical protein [Sphingomonas kyeonggiensis]MBB4097470.1 hypothetical protein [Sphingomonas kyeonggiensis]